MAKTGTEIEEIIRKALFSPTGELTEELAAAVVKNFLWLSSSTRALAVQRSSRYMSFLARAAEMPDDEIKRNSLEILERTGGTRVLRGLATFLQDRSPELRDRAAQAIIREIDEYVRTSEQLQAATGPASSEEITTRRKVYLEAIYLALSSYPIHKNADLLEALIRLDGGPHGLPIELLRRAKDARQDFILDLLLTRHSNDAISFLCRMLCDASQRARNRAQDIVARRDDVPFVQAFLQHALSEDWPQLAWSLNEVTHVNWLEPGHPLLKNQPPAIQLRAIAFLMATGLSWPAKMAKMEELAGTLRKAAPSPGEPVLAESPSLTQSHPIPTEQTLPPYSLDLPLDSSDETTQLRATETLAALNVPDKHKLLVKQLSSPFKSVRRLAMRELAQGSFRRYISMFDKMDEETRKMVGQTVAKIDDLMLDELESELFGLDPQRRLKTLKVIETIRVEKDVEDFLIDLADDHDVKVKATVVKLLGLIGSGTALKAMISCLSDSDCRVQANTVEAFERISDPRFLDLLRPFLRHPDNRVRANTAKALWALGDHEQPLEALREMVSKGDLPMRVSAAWALRCIDDPSTRQLLESLAFEDPSIKVRSMAQDSLEALEKKAP